MTRHSLTDAFDQQGEWWLPEAPSRRLSGRITVRADKYAELNLLDSFQPIEGVVQIADHIEYPIVLGTTANGEAVTLLNCQQMGRGFRFGSGGLRTPERLLSSWVLIGAHAGPGAPCSSVRFRVPGLSSWLGEKLIDEGWTEPGGALREGSRRREITYRVRWAGGIDVRSDAMPGLIKIETEVGRQQDTYTALAVHVSGWVLIESNEPQPLTWFIERFHCLSALFAILAGTPMSPDCICARADGSNEGISVLVAFQDTKLCEYRRPDQFFLSYPLLGTDFGHLLDRWFEVYSRAGLPCQLALSAVHSDGPWNHVRFVSILQALEGLHRGWFHGAYLPESEYDAVKKVLAAAIPASLQKSHRESLAARIKYGNQYSLRKRLNELANLLSDDIRRILFGGQGGVPGQWVDTRNYYTHWDETDRPQALDAEGMFHATVRMREVFRTVLLTLLEVPAMILAEALNGQSETIEELRQLNVIERRRRDPNDQSGILMTVTKEEAPNDSSG